MSIEMIKLCLKEDTQNYKVLHHMEKYGGITSYEAFVEYGITRLASRICELRKMGVPIGDDVMLKNGKHWKRYYLEVE